MQLLASLGCSVQTGVGTAINVAQAGVDDVLCMVGLGGVGLSAIMSAKIAGCHHVIGVDRVAS
jgi:Zn-dependent alcohol dehydrogenase